MKLSKTQRRWSLILFVLALLAIVAFFPLPPQGPVRYYERETGQLKTEKVAAEKWLVWLYNNPVGEATLWALVRRKLVSSVYGHMMDRPSSVRKIEPFIKEYDIDMDNVREQNFSSFNDFFTRELRADARPMNPDPAVAVSPADGKILAYQNIANSDFIVKGFRFNVETFLQDTALAQNYTNGSLVIVRLAPPDYHRFHFPVGGRVSPVTRIDGWYYSVNPIALREMADILFVNKRAYTIISNPLFGNVVMAEVGATMVGSIVQTFAGNDARKGEEKGYFKFGGSTIVLLFENNKIHLDPDLLKNTKSGFETAVKVKERIGTAE